MKNSDIFRVLSKYKVVYLIFQGLGLIYQPTVISGNQSEEKSRIKYHYHFIKDNGWKQYINYIASIFSNISKEKRISKYLKDNLPLQVICSTSLAKEMLCKYFEENRILCIHAQDYDKYLELYEKNEIIKERYIVFVDGGFGYTHIDYAVKRNNVTGEEKENYQIQLEDFLNQLEKKYKMSVVIAAHPHVNYTKSAYKDRKIFFNQTAELIKGAQLVVMHISTAINFVLLFNKPLLLLNHDILKLQMDGTDTYFEDNCKLFNIVPHDICYPEVDDYEVKRIDAEIRKQYIEKYIKEQGTPNKKIVECVETLLMESGYLERLK